MGTNISIDRFDDVQLALYLATFNFSGDSIAHTSNKANEYYEWLKSKRILELEQNKKDIQRELSK